MKHSLKFAVSLIKKYSKKSIFWEYLKRLFLIITLPFLIIFSGLYYYYQHAVSTEINYSVNRSLDRAYLMCNNMFGELTKTSLLYAENSYVQIFVNTPYELHNTYAVNYAADILRMMNISLNSSATLDSISIYSFENKYVMSSAGGGYIDKFTDSVWYDYYLKTGKSDFTISGNNYFYKVCGIYHSRTPVGLCIFSVKADTVNKMILGSLNPDTNKFYLVDNSGNTVFSTDYTAYAGDSSEKGQICTKMPLDAQSNITLIYLSRLTELAVFLRRFHILFIFCIIIALLAPLTVSLYISVKFYNSIAEIIASLNVSDDENTDEINEFKFISNHIMDIKAKNSSTEAMLVQKTTAFKRAQTIALQTQLNPHFLFNTLNLAGLTSRVMFKGSNPVTDIISLLSDLLSAALDTENYIVSVEREISYAKKYLDIQLIKYKNNFDTEWHTDENILACKTIKLILQPLIENALIHGTAPLDDRRGKITITSTADDTDIYFKIHDNGEKIPSEKLSHIRETLETNDMPEGRHIGLANVNLRIKLVFGDLYGVSITSDESGTTSLIRIPRT